MLSQALEDLLRPTCYFGRKSRTAAVNGGVDLSLTDANETNQRQTGRTCVLCTTTSTSDEKRPPFVRVCKGGRVKEKVRGGV